MDFYSRAPVESLIRQLGKNRWWGDALFAHRMRLLPQSLAAALYRHPVPYAAMSRRTSSGLAMEEPSFRPKKVLILSKITRYEFEKRVGWRAGVESRVVQRFDYTEEAIKWADAVMTAGGDGTYFIVLLRSEGYMCLMRKLPKEHFRSALQRLLDGDFQWLYRQRLRITLSGDRQAGVGDSIELHDQQLNRMPATTRWMDSHITASSSVYHATQAASPAKEEVLYSVQKAKKRLHSPPERVTIQLPVLALNEVFIGESLSSRVSYYEIQIDNGMMVKQKSSGIAICTGINMKLM
ncbi:hypothetical protein OSTOST_23200 [Ostertagia ostertagi]